MRNRLTIEQRITDGRCDPDDLHRFAVVRGASAEVSTGAAGGVWGSGGNAALGVDETTTLGKPGSPARAALSGRAGAFATACAFSMVESRYGSFMSRRGLFTDQTL